MVPVRLSSSWTQAMNKCGVKASVGNAVAVAARYAVDEAAQA
jgi:hypothetical protein